MTDLEFDARSNYEKIGLHGRQLLRAHLAFHIMCENMLWFFLFTMMIFVDRSFTSKNLFSALAVIIALNFIWACIAIIGSILSETALHNHLKKTT